MEDLEKQKEGALYRCQKRTADSDDVLSEEAIVEVVTGGEYQSRSDLAAGGRLVCKFSVVALDQLR